MPRSEYIESGYRTMWLLSMFDLPVVADADRKEAANFRKLLLDDGFSMLQFSVYARYCASEAIASVHRKYVQEHLPSHGFVRILSVTERQFEKMENYVGASPEPPEKQFEQLTFF